jgi:RNA polymerase sigma-70 factor (ECF subfamily)
VKQAGLIDHRESAEGKIFLSEVLKAVDQLPEAQKEAIYLVYVKGFELRRSGHRPGYPRCTLTSRLVRSRIKIAKMIRDPSEQERRIKQK